MVNNVIRITEEISEALPQTIVIGRDDKGLFLSFDEALFFVERVLNQVRSNERILNGAAFSLPTSRISWWEDSQTSLRFENSIKIEFPMHGNAIIIEECKFSSIVEEYEKSCSSIASIEAAIEEHESSCWREYEWDQLRSYSKELAEGNCTPVSF